MRRLSVAAATLLCGVLLITAGCKRKKKAQVTTPEPAAVLLSVVDMANPAGSVQLARGFFDLESNSWRWTAGRFTVVLRPPDGAAQLGARLELHFNLPGAIVDKIGPVTVSAELGGAALAPETYSKAGDYVYTRDVAAAALHSTAVTVNFATDKVLPPTGGDTRELALVVTSIGLVTK
jgi:hypothetical protein